MPIEPPVQQRCLCILPRHAAMMAFAALDPEPMKRNIAVSTRVPHFGIIGQEEPNENGRNAGGHTLDDEQPSPRREAVSLIHVSDAVRDGTAKSTGQSRTGEDKGNTYTALVGLVPKREVINQSREETGLGHAEQEPHSRHLRKGADASETDGDGAPGEHEEGQPARGSQLLKQDVRRHLEDGVCDEEDHQSDVELVCRRVRLRLHVVGGGRVKDARIADVGAVKVAEEVDAGTERYDDDVLLSLDALLFFWCVGDSWRDLKDMVSDEARLTRASYDI